MSALVFTPFVLAAAAGAGAVTPQGPTQELSPTRGEIVLNGVWDFSAGGADATKTTIRVPGSWSAEAHAPLGSGVEMPDLTEGIYRRQVAIPAAWAGRKIVLDLRRVSTQAEVSVNGKACGTVEWPYGTVDITAAATPGATVTLEIKVTALTPEGEVWALMGYATEERRKRTLASRGLIGDVLLESEPRGPRVTDVFVQPSVRAKKLGLDVELSDAPAGEWTFTARLLNERGAEEKVFTTTQNVGGGGTAKVHLDFPWENPRLWDIDQPNLYTLQLGITPPGAAKPVDVYPQRFGFREFWIEGKDFVLNGTKVRFRPRGGHGTPSHQLEMASFIEGSRKAGFNISQIWPENSLEPGHWNFWELFCATADTHGWPIIGALPSMSELIFNQADGKPLWDADPRARAAYLQAMEREMRRYRNFPSILFWGTSANINNHFADQNPAYLGQQKKLSEVPQNPASERVAREALTAIKEADPTRPVFVHAGSRLGDIFSVNHYLNLLPLQEREEMLSEYMQKGDVPYIGIEFGTPLNTTMNRGRAGFGPSHESEPFMTEYAAIYFGPQAYEWEPRDYRRNLRFGYTGKNWNGDWNQLQWLQSGPDNFQKLQALFIENTWRSWRTAGVTGGMIPWNADNQLFLNRARRDRVPAPAFVPGLKGPSPAELDASAAANLQPEGGWEDGESAKVFRAVNRPTMAWIAGPTGVSGDPTSFAAKDHSYFAGQTVAKSAALLNDTRQAQPYEIQWEALSEGRPVASGSDKGTLAPAETKLIPISFPAPNVAAGAKVEGEIRLKATVGAAKHDDVFAFRTFGAPRPLALPAVQLFDPVGKTRAMLTQLGVKTVNWTGRPNGGLLVVGREALSSRAKLPGSLLDYVRSGGRLLMFTQSPDFFVDSMGLRVAPVVTRRVFPVSSSHPVVAGLDEKDLRDWSSRSTLVPEQPPYDPKTIPVYGWRWGNRGAVSSAPIEKPHTTGWRPILEGEFDLAYSPLMELDLGKGRAILCTLDLEDAYRADPAADRLARQLLAYAAFAPIANFSRDVVFLGNDADYTFLTSELGLIAKRGTNVPPSPASTLLVVGEGAKVSSAALQNFAKAGGRVVILGQQQTGKPGLAGGELQLGKSFTGARQAPASTAARGLSASDLRFRSDLDWPIFKPSPQTDAAGLLHVQEFGKGAIVQTQLDPRWFNVENMPAFRTTRWRQTRALAQVLANQGATFSAETRLLNPSAQRVSLAGPWKVKITKPLPNVSWDSPHPDPGISPEALAAVKPDYNDASWDSWTLPSWYPPLDKQNGEVVWRRTIDVPAEWEGQIVQLGVARVKSYDTTYWNGVEVGSTDAKTPDAWNRVRRYRVPADLVKGGKLTIAIREFAPDTQGGVHGSPEEMFIRRVSSDEETPPLYHADYRDDFDFGDNPYRYYRW